MGDNLKIESGNPSQQTMRETLPISSKASCRLWTWKENKAEIIAFALAGITAIGGLIIGFAVFKGDPISAFRHFAAIGPSHRFALVASTLCVGLGTGLAIYLLIPKCKKKTEKEEVYASISYSPVNGSVRLNATLRSQSESDQALQVSTRENQNSSINIQAIPAHELEAAIQSFKTIEERVELFVRTFERHPDPENSCAIKRLFSRELETLQYQMEECEDQIQKQRLSEALEKKNEEYIKLCQLIIDAGIRHGTLTKLLVFLQKEIKNPDAGIDVALMIIVLCQNPVAWEFARKAIAQFRDLAKLRSFIAIENKSVKQDILDIISLKLIPKLVPYIDFDHLVTCSLRHWKADRFAAVFAHLPYKLLPSVRNTFFQSNFRPEFLNGIVEYFKGSRAIYWRAYFVGLDLNLTRVRTAAIAAMDFYQLKAIADLIPADTNSPLAKYAAMSTETKNEYNYLISLNDGEREALFDSVLDIYGLKTLCAKVKELTPQALRACFVKITYDRKAALTEEDLKLLAKSLSVEQLSLIVDEFIPGEAELIFKHCNINQAFFLCSNAANQKLYYSMNFFLSLLKRLLSTEITINSQFIFSSDCLLQGDANLSWVFNLSYELKEFASHIGLQNANYDVDSQKLLQILKSESALKLEKTQKFLATVLNAIPFKNWTYWHKIIAKIAGVCLDPEHTALDANDVAAFTHLMNVNGIISTLKLEVILLVENHSEEARDLYEYLTALKEVLIASSEHLNTVRKAICNDPDYRHIFLRNAFPVIEAE